MRSSSSFRIMGILLCIMALPAMAQVPRAVFAELNSATW